jgi:riboflavin synthase
VFTGIIEELGKVAAVGRLANAATLTIDAPLAARQVRPGSSVAVNGVCLTVTFSENGQFGADVMGETLARTTLGGLEPGRRVNLERPVPAGGGLDGHIVQGHVDGTGMVTGRRPAGNWLVLTIGVPAELLRYVAHKGSVAVDGVSLTVSALSDEGWLEVSLIPETLARTTLGSAEPGERVNIEVDVLAKYVERLLEARR